MLIKGRRENLRNARAVRLKLMNSLPNESAQLAFVSERKTSNNTCVGYASHEINFNCGNQSHSQFDKRAI